MTRDKLLAIINETEAAVAHYRSQAAAMIVEAEKGEAYLRGLKMAMELDAPAIAPSLAQRTLAQPDITLAQAVAEACAALETFTKTDLSAFIQQNHPNLIFSPKSLDKPLHHAISEGAVTKLRDSIGQSPAVYSFGKGAPPELFGA